MCCSVLQYVAVCCSMLQYVAVCCSVLQQRDPQYTAHVDYLHITHRYVLCVVVCSSVMKYVAVRYSMLQYVAVCCSVLQQRDA